jgi:hypothetical protein
MSDETDKRGTHPNSLANLRPELGESSRFGQPGGNKTAGQLGINTGSYRTAARQMSRLEMQEASDGKMRMPLPKKPTAAQYIMANVIAKASKGDMRAVEYLTDQVDGKVVQMNLNAEMAALDGMSPEQLEEYDRQLGEQLAILDRRAAAAEANIGASVENTPGADDGDAAGEVGRDSTTGDAAGV